MNKKFEVTAMAAKNRVVRINFQDPGADAEPQLVLSRARKLDFDTTLHFLEKHVPPRSSILEVGAGQGGYSFHFARRGNQVLATDQRASNIEAILSQVEREGLSRIQVRQLDPTRLDSLSDWDFQAVLCLAPYHQLRSRESRRRCLLECRRVIHDRGVVAVSYLNRGFAVAYAVQNGIAMTRAHYESLQKVDDPRSDYPDEFFNVTHFTTPEAVEAEVRSCGFEVIEHVATGGVYDLFSEDLDGMEEESYRAFLGYHLKTCGQPSLRGSSRRGLVFLKKV